MKVLFLVFLCLTCFACGLGERILALTPVSTVSHKYSFMPLIQALAAKGHQVTVVSPHRPKKAMANVTEIVIEDKFSNRFEDYYQLQKLGVVKLAISSMIKFRQAGLSAYDRLMANEEFRSMLHKRQVDLVIVDCILNEVTFPIIDSLNVPFVFHASSKLTPWTAAAMGVSPEYSYIPFVLSDNTDEMDLFQRAGNLIVSQTLLALRNFLSVRELDQYVKKDFPNARPISQIEKDASLCITNDHPTISWPRPLPPNVIPIAGLHVGAGNPLPQDLQMFADESTDGFIVFTLGSSIPVSSMPDHVRRSFLDVFSQIPQRVIWKWEKAEMTEAIPANVLLIDWLPQQDLLAHPNAKLFISHGGMLGIQEAVYHGVPMLGLPFGNDQRSNLAKLRKEGFALVLDWQTIDQQVLLQAIHNILNDSSFHSNATRLSRMFRDDADAGKEKAVYWIEYVLKHGGAKHLQLASRKMPFYENYLLDVWLLLASVAAIVSYALISIVKFILKLKKSTKQKVL